MKKTCMLTALAFVASLAMASWALALPQLGNGLNYFKFVNYETWLDLDNSRSISKGDLFYGVALTTTVIPEGQAFGWSSSDTDNLTSYFLLEVASTQLLAGGPDSQIHFKAATVLDPSINPDPNSIFNTSELQAGAVMKWFSDDTPVTMTNKTTMINTVKDGDIYSVSTVAGGYWYGNGTLLPDSLTLAQTLAVNFFGLNTLSGTFLTSPLIDNPFAFGQVKTQLAGQSNVTKGTTPPIPGWMFTSHDPLVVATPEPASMLLLGSGLLGIYGLRRRSKKSS